MTQEAIIRYFERNITGWEKIESLLNMKRDYHYSEFVSDMETGSFQGAEGLIPLFFLISNDIVLDRTYKRLFLRWFGEAVDKRGMEAVLAMIQNIAEEEDARHKEILKRMQAEEKNER